MDWDLLKMASQPNSGVHTVSKFSDDLVFAVIEHITNANRMVASLTVPADALLGKEARRLCNSLGRESQSRFEAVHTGAQHFGSYSPWLR